MGIRADIQTLTPGGRVYLYELDLTPLEGDLYRFHGYQQQGPIWWQGEEYSPWPIQAEGFGMDGQGAAASPRLGVGNANGFITALCQFFDDLTGAKLTRRLTLTKYLDAANFPEGNPTADPAEELPPEVWEIEQRDGEDPDVVTFVLESPLSSMGVQLPRRQIVANVCGWLSVGGYRGPYCGYTGGPVADENDVATADPARDRCSGCVTACKMRFGANNPLPYGSFPAASLVRT
ncbi:phage minor tail protein L [Pseudomonas nitroreducens]|uniref:phage minor tail protein L n=1 Tax=Pseudomonas nitroreducens TaxID=46680 RepID=UPI00265A3EAF|nr:phage minor tail protein L [Pseudomonas nitroreducens]MCP1652736.1 lambda family phage minor tail protein L [Pseudomonas nitroreducens]